MAVRTLKRVNSPMAVSNQAWARFISLDDGSLFIQNPATGSGLTRLSNAGAWSGNPLSMVPYRPPNSPETWAYIFDSSQQAKYKTDGTVANIGIMPPSVPPITERARPFIDPLSDNFPGGGPWSTSGSGIGSASIVNRVSTTASVLAIIYTNMGVGQHWCSIAVNNSGSPDLSWLGYGARLVLNFGGGNQETVTVEQTFVNQLSFTTTVGSIAYDSGSSGACCIQPVSPFRSLARNQIVKVGSEYVRIESVTTGPNAGLTSFRCATSSTHVAGEVISPVNCFRTYTEVIHSTGESITGYSQQATITLPGSTTSGIALASITFPGAPSGGGGLVNSQGTADDRDYIHWSFRCTNPQNITEVHFMFDVDTEVNDFSRNYYYMVFRQGDFTQLLDGAVDSTSSILTAVQNDISGQFDLNNPTPPTVPYPGSQPTQADSAPSQNQIDPGNNVWLEAVWHARDMVRVGSDPNVDYTIAKSIGLRVFFTGNTVIEWGGIWFGGGGGVDCNFNSYGNQGDEVQYRYRYRATATGARSDMSPATRYGVLPRRNDVDMILQGSADPQVDVIDVERMGGTFNEWKWVATLPNPGNITTFFTDTTLEDVASGGESFDLKQYVPFPVTGKPKSGFVNVVGTTVTWVSGDRFDLTMIRGVGININGQDYTLYRPPQSATFLELFENAGTFANVPYQIPEPTLAAKNLPYAASQPWDNRIWACGDPYNPNRLYFTNSDYPDTAADDGYIEIASPSEPLIAPFVFEGALYVFSFNALYRIEPTPNGANPYEPYKLSGSYGLLSPWSFDFSGPVGYYAGKDGIYQFTVNGSKPVSWGDLEPLFPHEGAPGFPVTFAGYTAYPIDLTKASAFRIAFIDNILYLDYLDISGSYMCLAYNTLTEGWELYEYVFGASVHYQEEGIINPPTLVGGSDNNIYQIDGSLADNSVAFSCVVATPSLDQGETRARKQYGDVMLDYLQGGSATLQSATYYDNYLIAGPVAALPGALTRMQLDLPTSNDNTSMHRNIAQLLTWQSTSDVILFEWQPSYIPQPDDSTARVTDWFDGGALTYKFVQGFRLRANTFGVSKQVQIQYDGGIIGPTLTVNHSTEMVLPYSFQPFKAHMMRLVPLDNVDWTVFEIEWIFNVEPEITGYWITQPNSLGMDGYGHVREAQLAYACTGPAVFGLIVNGTTYVLLNAPSTGGAEVKKYVPTSALKGKLWQLAYTGTGLQVYEKDCEFRCKQWGTSDPFKSVRIIGEENVTTGAKI